jgi:hypothetical protein
MKTLGQACKPRQSVFDRSKQDTALDLKKLLDGRIDPEVFFKENYVTKGMQSLLEGAFQRFTGFSDNGIFLLKQSMGGGKTHSMIALGLLSKYPEIRNAVLGSLYKVNFGAVRVVGFTGRESDSPLGVWGAIAEQLGKKEVFNDYYSPLQAPGQTAWINLLKGEPLLILLDELPPYFQGAKAKQIGNTDLSYVTLQALANLFVAVGSEELKNVCIVISDLNATYEDASEQINKALQTLAAEVGRGAVQLEPVGMNTDEIYHILRQRLFETLPDRADILEIAKAYSQSVRDAKQMDITNASPEKFISQIQESYPFHFGIRDLYARFRQNLGFQQTRGLIKLMRAVVANLYSEEQNKADRQYLIHAHDIDLNDSWVVQEVQNINNTLSEAISHDIASNGGAIAEILDSHLGSTDAQDACKLIYVASLANVPNAILGLTLPEIISYLCTPGRELSRLPKEVLGTLATKAWYLHTDNEGKLYFRNVQNLVATLSSYTASFQGEASRKQLKQFLSDAFTPTSTSLRDCYQQVLTFPSLDEIKLVGDKVTLVIVEPHQGGLSPDLKKFYEDLDYKNRILFLTGTRDTMEALWQNAAELKAIRYILAEMKSKKLPDSDPQVTGAKDLEGKILFALLSAMRETFSTLHYPSSEGLLSADFVMSFADNEYNGEKQIRDTLIGKQKFTEDIASETFRKKCEVRLFTQKNMLWTEIKRRAATLTQWQWHRPDALDKLKEDLLSKDQWRESGGYVEKPPFPKPDTSVQVSLLQRNDETGEATLRINAIHGDVIYYEIGGKATTASLVVDNPKQFKTSEMEISFLCVDSKGEHQTGEEQRWRNTITLKSREYQQGNDKMVEIQAAPPAQIRYSTDGSDPKQNGGLYDAPLLVPKGTVLVLAVAEKNGIVSDVHQRKITDGTRPKIEIDRTKRAVLERSQNYVTKQESFEFLTRLKKFQVKAVGMRVEIQESENRWLDFSTASDLQISAEQLEVVITNLRSLLPDGEITITSESLSFETGQTLLDWVTDTKTELRPDEVKQ